MYTETDVKEITGSNLDEGFNEHFDMRLLNPNFVSGNGPFNFQFCQANGKVMQEKDMTSSGFMNVNINDGASPYLLITQGDHSTKLEMTNTTENDLPFTFSTTTGGGSWFLRIKNT